VSKLEEDGERLDVDRDDGDPMAGVQQTTTLTFSAALEMQEVHQTGSQGGQQAKIDISYAGGRAKGKATTPSQTGPKTIDIDAEMPKGAVDDNALQGLMAAMKWAPGAQDSRRRLPVGQGRADAGVAERRWRRGR